MKLKCIELMRNQFVNDSVFDTILSQLGIQREKRQYVYFVQLDYDETVATFSEDGDEIYKDD